MSDTDEESASDGDAAFTSIRDGSAGSCPGFVVGIGASAGGLEALESFFSRVPADTKMAFVVVQHLSPDFKSMMDELLARQTALPIVQVQSETMVQAGHIYLLPPRMQMIIDDGRLLVTEKDDGGFSLPIDHLFRSLGQDQRERSIGVILSGTGGDGSRGIEHIHRGGGLVLAQSEISAAFDGMTRSAQQTGLVDMVLSPEEMPRVLTEYVASPSVWRAMHHDRVEDQPRAEGTPAVIKLLRQEYGIDFSHYKADMISRRIERRLQIGLEEDVSTYIQRLETDAEELSELYRDMLIGVTGFFRDLEAYEKLEKELLPKLIARLGPEDEFRVWVAATATGEEAYSIAILIDEYFTSRNRPVRCRIFATDVHQASLDLASQGLYPEGRIRELSDERRERYFIRESQGYRVAPAIRRLVVFASHNVISDAPFTKLDMISCRNLFIYLNPSAQRRVLTLFHFGLRVGGGLWLGSSEVPTELQAEFEPIDSLWKLYVKRRDVRLTSRIRLPSASTSLSKPKQSEKENEPAWQMLRTYDRLLDTFMPPSMLVTEDRRLLHSFAGAAQFISPADGRASEDLADQLDPILRIPFRTGIRKAHREDAPVEFEGITYPTDEGNRSLRLRVRPVPDPGAVVNKFLVEFLIDESAVIETPSRETVDAQSASSEHVDTLEKELAFARQTLSATIEELQAANEEMQSTNEELLASNEQLQSTNEELHSVNEELYTVNAEYQRKIAELTELTDDMDNLLNSTHVDTIFLDRELKVRKFTPDVAQKFNLLRQDIGRDFESFTYRLDDDDLISELRHVLRSERPFEREVRDRSGYVYLMRILPYVSRGIVDGVVLTLVDITSLKDAQTSLAELSEIVQQAEDAIFRVDLDGTIRTWNVGAHQLYGHDEEIIGQPLVSLFPSQMHSSLESLTRQIKIEQCVQKIENYPFDRNGQKIIISASMSPVIAEDGSLMAYSIMARDITARAEAEQEIRDSIERRDQFLAMLSHELRNPLGAIINAARLIPSVRDEETVLEQASDVVVRQSEQMSRLLDDLLDVSRITLGKIELKRRVFDLRDTLDEAVRVIRPAFEDHHVALRYDRGDAELWIDGDAARLQQVIVNLLRNAVKYTPSGGDVSLMAFRGRDVVEIRVRDSGVGIEPDMLDKVFEMFVQVNSSLERSQGGIGLGLTLVKAVVSLHGGVIESYSEGLGHGSEFRVHLPACTHVSINDEPKEERTNDIRTIVLVEDLEDARTMLTGLLEIRGYVVYPAADGRAGLEKIREHRPDVALIDIGLPEMDGYEVVRALRRDPATRSLFAVALTGYGQDTDRAAVTAAGFDEHLVKPLDIDMLNRVLADGNPNTVQS